MTSFSEEFSGLFDICQTDYSIYSELSIFPLFRSYTWKYNIQANKTLPKFKAKWQLFNLMFLIFFIFFITVSQTISVINRVKCPIFYTHETSGACAGVCACDHTHQTEKTVCRNLHRVYNKSTAHDSLHMTTTVTLGQ